jgi:hypothetical protein
MFDIALYIYLEINIFQKKKYAFCVFQLLYFKGNADWYQNVLYCCLWSFLKKIENIKCETTMVQCAKSRYIIPLIG